MQRHNIKAAVFVVALTLSTGAYAQGRHDEKPHGSAKPAAESTDKAAPATGGRHDSGSTTHAPAKKVKEAETGSSTK